MKKDSYQFRASLLVKTRIVEIQDDALVVRKPGSVKPLRTIQFRNIKYFREIYCCRGGDELGENRFPIEMLKIVPNRGTAIIIKSASYVGTGSKKAYHAEDHRAQFEAFKTTLQRKVVVANPLVPVVEGSLVLSIASLMLSILSGAMVLAVPLMIMNSDRPLLQSLQFLGMLAICSAVASLICYTKFVAFWPEKRRLG